MYIQVCESVCVHIILYISKGACNNYYASLYVCGGAIEFEFAKLADYIQVQYHRAHVSQGPSSQQSHSNNYAFNNGVYQLQLILIVTAHPWFVIAVWGIQSLRFC